MAAPRVDLYTAAHKVLRHEMYRLGTALSTTNFADAKDREAALALFDEVLALFEEHMNLEDDHAIGALERADSALAKSIAATHKEHVAVFDALRSDREAVAAAEGPAAIPLGAQLFSAVNGWIAEETAHMNREEAEAMPAFWKAYTDEELVALRTKMQADIPPPRMAVWLTLFGKTLNHQELSGMLSGAKRAAPPEVFERMCSAVKQGAGTRWAAVETALAAR